MATASANQQTSIYETTIENSALEDLLEKREAAKEERSSAQDKFRRADEAARAEIAKLEVGLDAPVRVGRFVLKESKREGGHRSFDVSESVQLSIGVLKTVVA